MHSHEAADVARDEDERAPYAVRSSKPSERPSMSESRAKELNGFCSVTTSTSARYIAFLAATVTTRASTRGWARTRQKHTVAEEQELTQQVKLLRRDAVVVLRLVRQLSRRGTPVGHAELVHRACCAKHAHQAAEA